MKDRTMKNLLARFARNESGATAIEYGLIAGLISVVLITVMGTIGTGLTTRFTAIGTALTGG
jgi:pilus assembly protein Flp/PilA